MCVDMGHGDIVKQDFSIIVVSGMKYLCKIIQWELFNSYTLYYNPPNDYYIYGGYKNKIKWYRYIKNTEWIYWSQCITVGNIGLQK